MAFIALPNIAWQRLLETGLDRLVDPPVSTYILPVPTYYLLMPTYYSPAPTYDLPAPTYDPPVPKNQPKITLGTLFHSHFHVLKWVQ